ncbi:molecular chaperone TorD family protein [Shewanella sp. 10N.286.52.B9]|uniref:TorD/DmsD family molecular chaperone n=1 Tax=Shewanella sp. 10N.286.52.B9 TaxID=1880837 RepID=UPI000C81CEAD|nr:molecular chaperone TorD family protein [Shewanella sp. 10N.286.52.B9]PMG49459.1 hypothetical protein BCU91_18470 [Shewanella sp. 10N.286.52.B9]
MSGTQRQIEQSTAIFNWLADIFYHPATTEKLQTTQAVIDEWPTLAGDPSDSVCKILHSVEQDGLATIQADFQRLFIGPGKKLVYPWGSVNCESEGLLFGKSTQRWEVFCNTNHIEITTLAYEPSDHFALFFSAIAAIMQSDNDQAIKLELIDEVLTLHFNDWGLTVLSNITEKSTTHFYAQFAKLALDTINYWKTEISKSQPFYSA